MPPKTVTLLVWTSIRGEVEWILLHLLLTAVTAVDDSLNRGLPVAKYREHIFSSHIP